MSGLFVHDHKFPRHKENYFNSYGFDQEFFNRYLEIFDEISIIAREKKVDSPNVDQVVVTNSLVSFFTIKNLKQLIDKSVREKIDLKIVESDYLVIRLPSILGLYTIERAKKLNKPYLIEVVGCPWDAISNKGFLNLLPAYVITHLTKKAIYNAKYVVYVTEEFLEKRYPTLGKYIACSNVTLEKVSQLDLDKRITKINSIQQKKKIVLGTCATIDVVYKGQQDVIKAISILKKEGYDIEYELVGGGNQLFLQKEAEKYGVLENVKFMGALKHNEVFDWLNTIDIYIHPSKQEGLSRAIIEAMSKACPVLSANAGGIYELIDAKYIFEKGDVLQICNSIRNMTDVIMLDQAQANQMRSKNYLKSVLYSRRLNFFERFILESKQSELENKYEKF